MNAGYGWADDNNNSIAVPAGALAGFSTSISCADDNGRGFVGGQNGFDQDRCGGWL